MTIERVTTFVLVYPIQGHSLPFISKDSYLGGFLKMDISDVVLGVYVLALQNYLLTLQNRLRWPFNNQSSYRWTQITLWVINCNILV